MSDHLNKILETTHKRVPVELIMKLLTNVRNRRYDYCCVVEGKTDELFYCHVNQPFFRRNNVKYISPNYIGPQDEYLA